MNEKEFNAYQERKKKQFVASHWNRVQGLLNTGHAPKEIVKIMNAEGYWGWQSSCFGVLDVQRLVDLAAREGL